MSRSNAKAYRSLPDCLGLEPPMLISLVGAGGKTSAMFHLARELSQKGAAVIISTTTKIFRPDGPLLLESDAARLPELITRNLEPGGVLALGAGLLPAEPLPKLIGFDPEIMDRLFQAGLADYILVEADGSRRLPIKAPRPGEPVIPAKSGLVLGLVGLSSLGGPADEGHVFGFDEFKGITGISRGAAIGPDEIKALLEHSRGLFKSSPPGARKAALLNQLDLIAPEKRPELVRRLADAGGCEVILGSVIKREFYKTQR